MLAVSPERRRELLRLIRLRQRERRRLAGRDTALHVLAESDVRRRTAPLVVCYGAGVDSTALLIEFIDRAIRPDLIVFADTEAEKPETYSFIARFEGYLVNHGFPAVTVVRLTGQKWRNLEHQCLDTRQLPSLAFGGHSCSLKWKVQPQHASCETGSRRLWPGAAGRR